MPLKSNSIVHNLRYSLGKTWQATFDFLSRQSRLSLFIINFIVVIVVGFVDLVTGFEISIAVFYLLPLALTVWFIDLGFGAIISVIATVVMLLADLLSGITYTNNVYFFIDFASRLAFMFIFAYVFDRLKFNYNQQKVLARTDSLTGVANIRFFYEITALELALLNRHNHPITLVYFDLDNFKGVNDRNGHHIGDDLLRSVARMVQSNLRKTDLLGRAGGDEFVILMPETDNKEAIKVIDRIRLQLIKTTDENGYEISGSFGIYTIHKVNLTVDAFIKESDKLMYLAKKKGKNAIESGVGL